MAQTAEKSFQKANYGLRREILSPMETLAQSVSTMAPTTTPATDVTQNINFNGFPAAGQSLYVSPTLSGLGITNKTIGARDRSRCR
jgi:hypothetical protein